MRKPPIPRAVPHRLQRERWAAAGACGVLAIGHTARVAVDAHHLAYLSVLDVVAIFASVGAGMQLALIDDDISWGTASGVAILAAAGSLVSLTVGFPGTDPAGIGVVSVIVLAASVCLLAAAGIRWAEARRAARATPTHPAAATRPERPRTPPTARRVGPARRGTERVRRAHRDPARPAA
jgi:hypothetical protein